MISTSTRRAVIQRVQAGAREMVRGPKVYGLHHAGVTVRDFEAAVSWYHQMFGFTLVTEMTLDQEQADMLAELYGQTGLSVRLGFLATQSGAVLEIFEFRPMVDAAPTVWHRPGYTHAAISVRDVAAHMVRLKARGVEFVTPEIQFTGGAHWAFCKDPDGNLVELIDFHANRLPLQHLGRLVGSLYKRSRYASYYR